MEMHKSSNISLLIPRDTNDSSRIRYKAMHYGIRASDIDCAMADISIDEFSLKLRLPESCLTNSPAKKVQRQGTPIKCIHQAESVQNNNEHKENNKDESNQIIIDEMTRLLPSVYNELQSREHHLLWVQFLRMVSKGEFPMDNIAYQLFLDVIKFHANKNIHSMRYTTEVKEFWALGYKLFRGKFIRFMGGYKASGRLDVEAGRKNLSPQNTEINFACPDVNVLREEVDSLNLKCDKPGILDENIRIFSVRNPEKSCKLSIDGRKIAPGFGKSLGEVDLFGNEDPPTLEEKRARLQEEFQSTEVLEKKLACLDQKGYDTTADCLDCDKDFIREHSITTLCNISKRIRELRNAKIKKQLALSKYKHIAASCNEQKYVYVISSLRTALFRINQCINDALRVIDMLRCLSSECAGKNNYVIGPSVDLNRQENYHCLIDTPPNAIFHQITPREIKQKTPQWHEIRNTARVTGSTMHRALGFDTLKNQQQHFNVHVLGKEAPPTEAKNVDAFKYGTDNEINAVATTVGKILPSLFPDEDFVEEGCEIMKLAEKTFMVVSPDGSLRNDQHTVKAIEIKCPLPGKVYTTDVHYVVPIYYICQILAEMSALKCENLLFISYTPQSTTVHKADFDRDLWNDLFHLATELLNESSRYPKKKHPAIEPLRKKLQLYQRDRISLLAEFPSAKAIPCVHQDLSRNTPYGNHGNMSPYSKQSISDMHEVARKVTDA